VTSLARPALSHGAVLILAMLAGNTYWNSHRSATDSIISMFSRQPLADASNLAYRFGSAEHARILLEELRRAPPYPDMAAGDEMTAELHFAALDGEYQSEAPDSPHIKSASVACLRFRTSSCDRASMKKLAAKFAQQRRN
jgi:hypothetical protein